MVNFKKTQQYPIGYCCDFLSFPDYKAAFEYVCTLSGEVFYLEEVEILYTVKQPWYQGKKLHIVTNGSAITIAEEAMTSDGKYRKYDNIEEAIKTAYLMLNICDED